MQNTTMVHIIKVLYPLSDQIEILIPGDSWTKYEILIRYNEEK